MTAGFDEEYHKNINTNNITVARLVYTALDMLSVDVCSIRDAKQVFLYGSISRSVILLLMGRASLTDFPLRVWTSIDGPPNDEATEWEGSPTATK